MRYVAACRRNELSEVIVPHNIEAYWAVMYTFVELLVVVGVVKPREPVTARPYFQSSPSADDIYAHAIHC